MRGTTVSGVSGENASTAQIAATLAEVTEKLDLLVAIASRDTQLPQGSTVRGAVDGAGGSATVTSLGTESAAALRVWLDLYAPKLVAELEELDAGPGDPTWWHTLATGLSETGQAIPARVVAAMIVAGLQHSM